MIKYRVMLDDVNQGLFEAPALPRRGDQLAFLTFDNVAVEPTVTRVRFNFDPSSREGDRRIRDMNDIVVFATQES